MTRFILFLLLIMANSVSFAGNIAVSLLDNQQNPLANAVVYLIPKTESFEPVENMAIMDQVDTQFYPHILAVQRNTQVSFPNSDSIQHHVYSFSSAKVFELELYKGLRADPLLFDNLGVVEMGCNVHDWMLGYIYVVDTPYFKKSDYAGEVTISVPDGEYTLKAWHPRISDSPESFQMMLSIQGDTHVSMSVPSALLPDVNAFEDAADEFGEYE